MTVLFKVPLLRPGCSFRNLNHYYVGGGYALTGYNVGYSDSPSEYLAGFELSYHGRRLEVIPWDKEAFPNPGHHIDYIANLLNQHFPGR